MDEWPMGLLREILAMVEGISQGSRAFCIGQGLRKT